MTRLQFLASLSALSLSESGKAKEKRYSHSASWLGDVFPDISRRLKTPLICSDKDYVAGEYLFVHLDNMNKEFIQKSFVNLFSYRPHKWYWEETKEGDRLCAPKGAIVNRADLDTKILEVFSDYIENAINSNDISELRELFPEESDIELKITKNVIDMFGSAIKDKEFRRKLIMEQGKLKIPIDQASKEIKAFATQQMDIAMSKGFVPSRPTAHVLFNISISPNKSTPSLSFQIDPIGGYTYAGGRIYEKQFQEAMEAGWFLPGDSRTHEKDKLILPKTGDGALQMLGETVGNVLARLPYVVKEPLSTVQMGFGNKVYNLAPGVFPPEMAAGKTVGEFRRILREEYPGERIYSKWRGDTLFLSYPAWVRPQPYLAWQSVRHVLAAKREERVIGVADLLEVCGKIDRKSLACLGDEFEACKSLSEWQGVLGPLLSQPSLRRLLQEPGGILWETAEARLTFRPGMTYEASRVQAQRVRLALSDSAPRGRRVGLELLGKEKQLLATLYLDESDPRGKSGK